MAIETPIAGDSQSAAAPKASQSRPDQRRVDYLDGLRGLACMLVVFSHCFDNLPWHFYLPVPGHPVDIAGVEHLGYCGVNLFLVLSGICLFLPVVRKDGVLNVRDFAIRRCWRIIPPYYAALILILPVIWYFSPHFNAPLYGAAFVTHLLFIHNFFFDYAQKIIGPGWTLALEAQWYLVFPLLVIAYRLFPPRAVLASTLVLSVAFRAVAVPLFAHAPGSGILICIAGSLPARIFEFSLGMFMAGHLINPSSPKYRLSSLDWFWVAVSALQILWLYHAGWGLLRPRTWPFTDAAYGILFAALTLLGANVKSYANRLLTSKAAIWFGTISYSVYLSHIFVQELLGPRLAHLGGSIPHANLVLGTFVLAPACVLFGWLFFLAFERPALNKLAAIRSAQKQTKAMALAEEASDLTASP